MVMPSLALYVHFPFCLSICPYCDFDRQATGFDRIDVYLDAVMRELEQYAGSRRAAHSIFFGGGTPESDDACAGRAGAAALFVRHFDVQRDAEITLECNPGDADLEKLTGFKAAGATRLSFGVQASGRRLPEAARAPPRRAPKPGQAAAWAREAGFHLQPRLHVRLARSVARPLAATLEQAVALEPDHLSCYLLTLDERVPMGRDVARGKLVLPGRRRPGRDVHGHAPTPGRRPATSSTRSRTGPDPARARATT